MFDPYHTWGQLFHTVQVPSSNPNILSIWQTASYFLELHPSLWIQHFTAATLKFTQLSQYSGEMSLKWSQTTWQYTSKARMQASRDIACEPWQSFVSCIMWYSVSYFLPSACERLKGKTKTSSRKGFEKICQHPGNYFEYVVKPVWSQRVFKMILYCLILLCYYHHQGCI